VRYAVVFSMITMRSAVHSEACRFVSAAKRRPYMSVVFVDADSPRDVVRIVTERDQLLERGLKEPRICKCVNQ
jgi:hypothetical protein